MNLAKHLKEYELLSTKNVHWFECVDYSFNNTTDLIFEGINFSNADFSHSIFNNVRFTKCIFHNCNFSSSSLNKVIAEQCDFTGSDFSGSELSNSSLKGSNLSKTNLTKTGFTNVNLMEVIGNSLEIKSFQMSDLYKVVYTSEHLYIGCQCNPIEEWFAMDTRQLLTIDGKKAVRFRDEWKETLRLLIDNHPAKPFNL